MPARMKFLCDPKLHRLQRLRHRLQERNETPWGVNRRRGVTSATASRRALRVGRLHACTDAPAWRCARWTAYPPRRRQCCTTRTCVWLRLLYFAAVRCAPQFPPPGCQSSRQDGQVHFCAGGPETDGSEKSSGSTAEPDQRRQVAVCAEQAAPRRCWAADPTSSRHLQAARARPAATALNVGLGYRL